MTCISFCYFHIEKLKKKQKKTPRQGTHSARDSWRKCTISEHNQTIDSIHHQQTH